MSTTIVIVKASDGTLGRHKDLRQIPILASVSAHIRDEYMAQNYHCLVLYDSDVESQASKAPLSGLALEKGLAKQSNAPESQIVWPPNALFSSNYASSETNFVFAWFLSREAHYTTL